MTPHAILLVMYFSQYTYTLSCINVGLIGGQEQARQGNLATYTSLSDSNTIKYSLENITLVRTTILRKIAI